MAARKNSRFGGAAADYAEVQREIAAQRRSLVARMRRGGASSPAVGTSAASEQGPPPPVGTPTAPSTGDPGWLQQIGWDERPGLEATRCAIAAAIEAGPSSLSVCLFWPSPPPSSILAWAGRSIAGEGDTFGDARVLFAGMASSGAKLLKSVAVDRKTVAARWRPREDRVMDPRRDAMATAFLPDRLRAGAPAAFPCGDLAPFLHVNARDGAVPWATRWKGFLKSGRAFVEPGHGGRYGHLRDRFGAVESTRPFGFVVPRVSAGRRRADEIAAIPGQLDAVVLDLSPRWMGPWNVADALEQALVDLRLARPGRTVLPPVVALVSDPRCALAAMKVGSEARTHGIIASTHLQRAFHIGGTDGAIGGGVRGDPERVVVHAAATHEAEIAEALLTLAGEVQASHPETAEALAGAADTLSAMAHTTRPPLAEGAPAEQRFTFVDAEARVREALGREGDLPARAAIDRTLLVGRDAARRLMRETPARLALQEAIGLASSGSTVGFVVEFIGDAVEARRSAPPGLVVASRNEAMEMLSDRRLDRLVLACRGADALRLLAELPHPGRDVVLVLAPNEAVTAGRIAEHLLSWPEFDVVRTRCAAFKASLPPTLGRLLELTARAPVTLGTRPRMRPRKDTAFRAAAETVVLFDDGTEEGFAVGGEVVVLNGGDPTVRSVSELAPGDLIVLPPQAVSDEVAREMGWDGEAALIDDEVTAYKAVLATWLRTAGAAAKPQEIVRRMREIDPAMSTPHPSTVRYWLSAAKAQLDPAPRASTDPQWFAAFCRVIGYEGGDPHALGDHFDAHRARLRRDGHLRRCLVERFLFARYDAQLHHDIAPETIEALRRRVLSYVRAVADVHGGGWGAHP